MRSHMRIGFFARGRRARADDTPTVAFYIGPEGRGDYRANGERERSIGYYYHPPDVSRPSSHEERVAP